MDLHKKKELASRVLKVGKNRIEFNSENLSEIKEAITKQDIRDLYAEGIISIKPIGGRRKIVRRKSRRGPGKIKKKVKNRKQEYVKITRKLRGYYNEIKKLGKLDPQDYKELRKKIKMRAFRSKANLKEHLGAEKWKSTKNEENKAKQITIKD